MQTNELDTAVGVCCWKYWTYA